MKIRFACEKRFTVRFSDTDAMGHVNNSRYFSYMEEGRFQFFKELCDDLTGEQAFRKFPFIVGDIQCRFIKALLPSQPVLVTTGVTAIGQKSFVLEYDVYEEESQTQAAQGRSTLVMFDYQKQETFPIPDELRKILENKMPHE